MFSHFKSIARLASCAAFISFVSYAEGKPSANNLEYNPLKFQMPFELTTNVTYSSLDYNMKTGADSILKWRDSAGFGFDVEIAKNFTNKFRGVARFSETTLNGGAMSDYDLENGDRLGGQLTSGVFSETKTMSGRNMAWSFLGGYNYINNAKKRVTFLFGYEGRRLILDPRGINQILVEPNGAGFVGEDANSLVQNTKATLHGLQIGVDYLKNVSDYHRFGVTASAFIPLYYRSEQFNWGYGNNGHDWRLTQTGLSSIGQMGGLSLKLQNQFKVAKNIWWNIYVFGNVLAIKNPTETDRQNNQDVATYRSQNAKITQFGIGTGFSFE